MDMSYEADIKKIEKSIKDLEKETLDKKASLLAEMQKLTHEHHKNLAEQKRDYIQKVDKYLSQLSTQHFYRPASGGEGLTFTIVPFKVATATGYVRKYVTLSWKTGGVVNISFSHPSLKLEDIDGNTISRIKASIFGREYHTTRTIPKELKNSNEKASRVLSENYKEAYLPHNSYESEKKLLEAWVKSLYSEYTEKAAKAHNTAKKFGI
jgi:hypothetical protein